MGLQYLVIHLWLISISIHMSPTDASLIAENTNSGSCRRLDGESVCCSGKQFSCRGVKRIFTKSYPYSKLGYQENEEKSVNNLPSSCFCDEFCVGNNDCCWDYGEVCSKPKVDCEVTSWGRWSPCSNQCGDGSQMRMRGISKNADNGGEQCPLLNETRACQGYLCGRRRVGRSGSRMVRYMDVSSEVANLLPVRGDIQNKIKRFDMRWDIRRSLYLIQLIKENKTEIPDPEPYCVMYEITKTNAACKSNSPSWQFEDVSPWNDYNSLVRSTRPQNSLYFSREYPKQMSSHLVHPWITPHLMRPGQQICATCYPRYMRPELGNRCPGTGYPGFTSRWRALHMHDCQGTFMMITDIQRACTCGVGPTAFILT